MVNNVNISKYDGVPPNEGESRDIAGGPIYELEEILKLAREHKLNLWTKKAVRDTQTLGWDIPDVADLLEMLPGARFKGSEWCENGKILNGRKFWAACDAFSIQVIERMDESQTTHRMEYYVKIGIIGSETFVLITSCHD